MQIDSKQMRAARALLQWTQEDIAEKSGVSLQTIKNTESDRSYPHAKSMDAIQRSFEDAGVEFMEGSGVRLRTDIVRVYKGAKALEQFWLELYRVMSPEGGEYLAFGLEEKKFWDFDETATNEHVERIKKHQKIHCKALVAEADENLPSPHIQYRALSREHFSSVPFYVFKNKLALIVWEPAVQIIMIENESVANAYEKQFNVLWKNASPIEVRRK